MTREKAFNILHNASGVYHPNYLDALNMAIKALEQEPCEDAVSRKELLKIYEDRFFELQKLKHLKDNKGLEDRQYGVNWCINTLKDLPSVNPQKIGHWIEPKDFMWENPKCSECGFESADHDNYCPHCGAKMVEPQESEEV